MKEDFLHYIWRNKKFDFSNLKSTIGEEITIINSGSYLQLQGPDFFNAQLIISDQKWAGNVEMHLKSSDWYLHHHETDSNYNNVILHVVWEHDTDVFRANNQTIPVLELKNYVSKLETDKYLNLLKAKSWINCENEISKVDSFIMSKWQERLFLERLEVKTASIQDVLDSNENDWEAALFVFMSKYFGLNINGDAFYKMATSLPFSVVRKEQSNLENLEALFFGASNLLNEQKEDVYYNQLCDQWTFLQVKYNIQQNDYVLTQFFKLRPDNFPTIRLSQLAFLYNSSPNLFSKIINVDKVDEFYSIFSSEASEYWKTHYVFDKQSNLKAKKLTKQFINLLVINVIVPFKFLYMKQQGNVVVDELISLLIALPSESNVVLDKFKSFNVLSDSAFNSQSLLHLKKEYCSQNKCLNCAIGISLLK